MTKMIKIERCEQCPHRPEELVGKCKKREDYFVVRVLYAPPEGCPLPDMKGNK